jgi:type I restriction enzyme S subunit
MIQSAVSVNEAKPLPDGWWWVRLRDVCEKPQYGYTASAETAAVGPKFLRITDIQNGEVHWERVPYCRCGAEAAACVLKPGDILFARTGGTTGKSFLVKEVPSEAIFASYLIRVRTKDDLMPEYLYLFLQSDMYWRQVITSKRGGAQPNMNATLLGDVLFPFPPRPEQKRIVAKIQESMKEVEHARIACEARLEAAKALPQAYLRQVFESEEAKQWERRRLGEVCEFLDSLRVPVNDTDRQRRIEGKKQTELYPYYGANGQVGWIDDYLFDEELVLLAEDGGFFGSFDRPIAYRVNGKCWVNNHAHVLRARRELINVDWLYFTLAIRPDVIQFVSGTTRMKLTQEQASIVPLPLPPLTEQKHIATELKDKITDAEKLKADIEKQLEAIKTLPQAILRKAFSGEL